MNSPFTKTLFMGALAAITSIVAAYYYPWPQAVVESATVGKPLFESYDSSSVRTMRIMRYNDDKSIIDRIQVRRRGEKWVIPSRKEFIANNVQQYTASANCLNERTVLEERTENQEDHVKYGVVDPVEMESTSNRSALGTKVMLEDRQGRSIASLIVGKQVSDDPAETKHFVRIPGQPTVYVCEFDRRAIITDFRAWVDPNLFQIGGVRINEIKVEDYRLNPEPPNQMVQQNYRAKLNVGRQQMNLLSVEIPGGLGSWKPTTLSQEMAVELQTVGKQLVSIQFSDVQRKKAAAANLLEAPKSDADAAALKTLVPFGFVKTGFDYETYQFNATGGEVSVETEDGVIVTFYIGEIAKTSESTDLQLNHFAMMTAGVNEKAIEMPEQPAVSEDPEQAEKDKKEYLRKIEKRNGQLKNARIRASELNQRFADWIYIVPERVITNLRPEVNVAGAKPKISIPSIIPKGPISSGPAKKELVKPTESADSSLTKKSGEKNEPETKEPKSGKEAQADEKPAEEKKSGEQESDKKDE